MRETLFRRWRYLYRLALVHKGWIDSYCRENRGIDGRFSVPLSREAILRGERQNLERYICALRDLYPVENALHSMRVDLDAARRELRKEVGP